jgi:hypothetical protein
VTGEHETLHEIVWDGDLARPASEVMLSVRMWLTQRRGALAESVREAIATRRGRDLMAWLREVSSHDRLTPADLMRAQAIAEDPTIASEMITEHDDAGREDCVRAIECWEKGARDMRALLGLQPARPEVPHG